MKTFALMIAAIIAFDGGIAQAQTESSQEVVRVSSSNTPVEARRMLERLQTAALDVCGAPFGSDANFVQTVKASACYRGALSRAVSQIDAPALSDAFAAATSPRRSLTMADRR